MSVYSNVPEQDLIILRRLAEQQKDQRALKIKNRILKQTHDIKLAEIFSPITKKLEESTKKLVKLSNHQVLKMKRNKKYFLLKLIQKALRMKILIMKLV